MAAAVEVERPLAVVLEKGQVLEAKEIAEFGRFTFHEAFAALNDPKNLESYLNEAFTIEKFTDQLNNANSIFYVARVDGEMAGYTKFNFGDAQTEPVGEDCMEIERIYVKAKFYGKSVGQMLFDKAWATAKEKSCPFIWLGVWEKNDRALKFYKKNGFVEFSQHIYDIGDDPQTDIMMKRML